MRVDLGATWMEVEDHGSGIPMILVHGFPLSSEMWAPVRPALAEVCRVITPDLVGFGHSDKPQRVTSIDSMADEVIGLADALGVGRFVLGGHSMGGYVVLSAAVRYADRVAGLILVDTRAEGDDAAGRRRREEAVARIRDGGRGEFLDAFVPNLVGPSTRTRGGRLVEDLRAIAEEVPDHVLVACLTAMRDRGDRREALTALDIPALVVVGEEDDVTPPAAARDMAARLPRATLAVVPGAGHTPSVERPIALAQQLGGFLATISQQKPS